MLKSELTYLIISAPSIDQKSHLAGSIARALAVFCVDEIVIFEDNEENYQQDGLQQQQQQEEGRHQTPSSSSSGLTAYSDPSHYLAHVLSYLETPPHLRKRIFPMHPNLRTAGVLPSLDMPHHLRQNEWCDYRDGVMISSRGGNNGRQRKEKGGKHVENATVVDTGLPQKVTIRNAELSEGTRVTVRLSSQQGLDVDAGKEVEAELVNPSVPREEAGYYWGYSVRRCSSLSSVFTECPFDGGYDLSFGTSERGVPISDILDRRQNKGDDDIGKFGGANSAGTLPDYKHLLLVFGGVAGLEIAVRNDRQLRDMSIRPVDTEKLFDYWVNLLPGQGSRTIRTEEAVWIGLTGLTNLVEKNRRRRDDDDDHQSNDNTSSPQVQPSQHHHVDDEPKSAQENDHEAGPEHDPGQKKKKKKKSKKEKRGLS